MFESRVTVEECIRQGAVYFEANSLYFGHGTDNALDEAALLVCWVVKINWEDLDARLDELLTPEDAQTINALYLQRVGERVPAAYLTGEAWFAGLKFKVNQHVLVPRSPLAELIQKRFQPWLYYAPKRILDLCCGSGCVGLACAHHIEGSEVCMSDISGPALEVAKENVGLLNLSPRVNVIQSDAFEHIEGAFDLIISNPPYVDELDLASMPAEYKAEPEIGLSSGKDGLEFTRIILKNAAEYLNENGALIVEVGNSGEALEKLLPHVPFVWPEFEYGGHGVFILSREDLLKHEKDFENL